MKHIKLITEWITSTSNDVNVNYNNSPELGEFAQLIVNYINDNTKLIVDFQTNHGFSIELKTNNIENNIAEIKLYIQNVRNNKTYNVIIKFIDDSRSSDYQTIIITEEEHKYLDEFFFSKYVEYKKKRERESENTNTVLNQIDPVRKSAKKFNI